MQLEQTKNKVQLNLSVEKALAVKCRRSFYYFVKYFWDTVIAEPMIDNWHIKFLCDELQAIGERVALLSRGKDENGKDLPPVRLPKEFDYYIINIPPGSSKSTITSEMYPIWCWTIDATQRFICGSYAATPAEDIAEKCFNIFTSGKFKALYPELVSNFDGGKTHFKNGLRGERYTTSIGGSITAVHGHQLLIDDPMNPKIAASETERTNANKWISETLSTRKVNKAVTVTIIIMQRLHELDTTGYLLKKPGLNIKHICIPAEISKDVKPAFLRDYYINGLFDVERASKEILISSKAELGTYGYAGQMQQRPAPEEGGIIKKHWFEIVDRVESPAISVVNFQLDTAYTEKTDNDPTAIISYYVEAGFVYITNVQSVYKEFPDLIKWIPVFVFNNTGSYKRHEARVFVEPKASGISVVQTIRKATDLNIIESEAPKDDKLTRLYTVSPKIEAGRVKLHRGGWNESFITQVISFPNAQNDDEVDCLTAIIKRELMEDKGINPSKIGFF